MQRNAEGMLGSASKLRSQTRDRSSRTRDAQGLTAGRLAFGRLVRAAGRLARGLLSAHGPEAWGSQQLRQVRVAMTSALVPDTASIVQP